MNIKQAKEYIKQTVRLYLKKDDLGDYRIPVVRQRPVFMLGAPGVGKTAIMEQVAGELGIALVSYSMTHHTRQSAIGLPFIRHRVYDGVETDVTEYTMSEIIASVYETMESSGIKEGILFLDEINCVSETLYPSMLQFLQYKVFGPHRVPEGWVIVTAGNPPEFNRSVRQFDVAVMDRLKVLEVEPDYEAFKEYAHVVRLHPAIMGFLDIKREYFYRIEKTAGGRTYVTARGWEDLSEIMGMYEEERMEVEDSLIMQYIGSERVVREFYAYYELFNKYRRDYRIGEILAGRAGEDICKKAGSAPFDERLSLLSMLMDRVMADIRDNIEKADYMSAGAVVLKSCSSLSGKELTDRLDKAAEGIRTKNVNLERAGALTPEESRKNKSLIRLLEDLKRECLAGDGSFEEYRNAYNARVAALKEESRRVSHTLHSLFDFCERAYTDGNELLILVTELTVNPHSSRFIARFGSADYDRHRSELMLTERAADLQQEARDLLSELAP